MEEKSASENPVDRYRHDQPAENPPRFFDEKTAKKIESFIRTNIGEFETVFHEVVSRTIHVDVYRVEPTKEHNFITLVTGGMSAIPMNTPRQFRKFRFAELMISLPADWNLDKKSFQDESNYWPIRMLKALARFPYENHTWLSIGHSVPNGDPPAPFSPNTGFTDVMLFPSAVFTGRAWSCRVGAFKEVYYYSALPLYPSELQYKLDRGSDALMELFDEHDVSEVVDITREPVC